MSSRCVRAASALLRAASGSASTSRTASSTAAPAGAAALEQFRERVAAGPDLDAFILPNASKEGYSVPAPPLKARTRTVTARLRAAPRTRPRRPWLWLVAPRTD